MEIINRKNKIHKKWRIHPNNDDFLSFKHLRRESKARILAAYDNFILNIKKDVEMNSKRIFSISSSKRLGTSMPLLMRYNNETDNAATEICELFAIFIRSVFAPPTVAATPPLNQVRNSLLSSIRFVNSRRD
ncbi:hypothetical protein HHI36_003138 [Cryptolaemus montrouzieri]|uniref:Uncharacterized protein n=1 Tax=Cryptolaemus montrouzieri TaxID=559131 RepID=A0ABD2PCK8_9CUCU